jgi:2'-5' RNA ligase
MRSAGLRCFIGLPIPTDAIVAATDCAVRIRMADGRWSQQKWVRPENLHVTVSFLGDVERSSVGLIVSAMSDIVASSESVWVRFKGVHASPRKARASLLWITCDDGGSVGNLARALGEAFGTLGYQPDDRPFVPHVTLVRARRPLRAPAHLEELFETSSMAGIVVSDPPVTLFSSRLTPQGPVYSCIASFKVGEA